MKLKKGLVFTRGGSTFRVLEDVPDPKREAVSRRAAALAQQLSAIMAPFEAMSYLGELALACIVSGRTGRAAFEGRIGEKLPQKLWRELELLATAPEDATAKPTRARRTRGQAAGARPPSARKAKERRFMLPLLALGCVAVQKGAKQVLGRRVKPPLSDQDWVELEREVLASTPKQEKRWRQLRAAGLVSFPTSFLS